MSYRDKRTRDFAAGKRVKAFSGFGRSARLKLDRLEAATSLIGDGKGQYIIRINDQWRVCFEWADRSPGPSNVEIVDYHSNGFIYLNNAGEGASSDKIIPTADIVPPLLRSISVEH